MLTRRRNRVTDVGIREYLVHTRALATGVQAEGNTARRSGNKRYYTHAAHATREVEGSGIIE